MEFAGYVESAVLNEDGSVAYYQYEMSWKEIGNNEE